MKKKISLTCIAAIKDKKGRIYVASDRRASWDFSQAQAMPRPKLQKRNGIILSGTGDGYLCHLIVDMLEFPHIQDDQSTDEYMHSVFYGKVLMLLKRKGFVDDRNQLKIAKEDGAEILVAVRGVLYTLSIRNPDPSNDHPNGQIAIDEVATPYATGCGGALAWGSLLTTEDLGFKPKERLIIALNVAAKVSPGCDNNIDIEREDD